MNIGKQKLVLLPIYRNLKQDQKYSIDNFGRIINKHTPSLDNALLIGDFNMVIGDKVMSTLDSTYELFSF